jgi:hypothetical protein
MPMLFMPYVLYERHQVVSTLLRVAGFRHFPAPIYQTPSRLLLIASKRSDSILNLSAVR